MDILNKSTGFFNNKKIYYNGNQTGFSHIYDNAANKNSFFDLTELKLPKICKRDKNSGCHTKSVTFIVTYACNLRCTYCYEKKKDNKHRMTFETGKKIVDLLFEEDAKDSMLINRLNADAIILDFIGGEPLLEIDLIDKICTYFYLKAVELNHRWVWKSMINISSNGIEYFNPKVQKFVQKFNHKVSLSITIDGNKKLHDACRLFPDGSPSFDIVNKAYKDALNKHLTNSTKMTIAPANLPYLAEAIKDLMNYDHVKFVPANPVFEENWTYEQAKLYYDQLKELGQWMLDTKIYKEKGTLLFANEILGTATPETEQNNGCGGDGGMMAFDTDGKLYPCIRYAPLSLCYRDGKEWIIGDVYNGGILSNEEELKRIKCLQCMTRRSRSTDECYNCPISANCRSCIGWDYDLFGTPEKRATGICNMHKAQVLANIWYWNKLYRQEGLPERFEINIPEEWALKIIPQEEWEELKKLAKYEGENYAK